MNWDILTHLGALFAGATIGALTVGFLAGASREDDVRDTLARAAHEVYEDGQQEGRQQRAAEVARLTRDLIDTQDALTRSELRNGELLALADCIAACERAQQQRPGWHSTKGPVAQRAHGGSGHAA